MIASGQALPCIYMMICCPRAMLSRVNFIAPGASSASSDHYEFIWIPLVFMQIVTENEFLTCLIISCAFWNFLLGNLFQTLIMSVRKTTLAPEQLLRSVHVEKSYLGKAGYPVLYNG